LDIAALDELLSAPIIRTNVTLLGTNLQVKDAALQQSNKYRFYCCGK